MMSAATQAKVRVYIVLLMLIAFLGPLLWMSPLSAEEVPKAKLSNKNIVLEGVLTTKKRDLNVSAIAFNKDRRLLVVGSDEGSVIQVLKRNDDQTYKAKDERNIELDSRLGNQEIDIEGIAWGKKYVYVIGSHSRKRERVKYKETDPKDNKKAKKNRERLRTTATEPSRERLYRVKLDEEGQAEKDSIDMVTLRNIFANDKLLRPFQALPSKENGIDIEGIAADGDDKLYIGFRGPVLRGNYVPVMVIEFKDEFKENDIDAKVKFVNLDGLGIRDMLWVNKDEFLILAGPMGDGPGSYRLYHWNGEHCVPGRDEPQALLNAKLLCEIPLPDPGAKAEGLALLDRQDDLYEVMVVYDGVANGGARVFSCNR